MEDKEYIGFYERDFYVFSNFSFFIMEWKGKLWPTSEYVYQSERFADEAIKEKIRNMRSSHEAFRFAQENKHLQVSNWGDIKIEIMKEILREKVRQHPYVRKKLIDSGDRELIEDSWRDDFWGWGANKDGVNQLGKCWMEVRTEVTNKKL